MYQECGIKGDLCIRTVSHNYLQSHFEGLDLEVKIKPYFYNCVTPVETDIKKMHIYCNEMFKLVNNSIVFEYFTALIEDLMVAN